MDDWGRQHFRSGRSRSATDNLSRSSCHRIRSVAPQDSLFGPDLGTVLPDLAYTGNVTSAIAPFQGGGRNAILRYSYYSPYSANPGRSLSRTNDVPQGRGDNGIVAE